MRERLHAPVVGHAGVLVLVLLTALVSAASATTPKRCNESGVAILKNIDSSLCHSGNCTEATQKGWRCTCPKGSHGNRCELVGPSCDASNPQCAISQTSTVRKRLAIWEATREVARQNLTVSQRAIIASAHRIRALDLGLARGPRLTNGSLVVRTNSTVSCHTRQVTAAYSTATFYSLPGYDASSAEQFIYHKCVSFAASECAQVTNYTVSSISLTRSQPHTALCVVQCQSCSVALPIPGTVSSKRRPMWTHALQGIERMSSSLRLLHHQKQVLHVHLTWASSLFHHASKHAAEERQLMSELLKAQDVGDGSLSHACLPHSVAAEDPSICPLGLPGGAAFANGSDTCPPNTCKIVDGTDGVQEFELDRAMDLFLTVSNTSEAASTDLLRATDSWGNVLWVVSLTGHILKLFVADPANGSSQSEDLTLGLVGGVNVHTRVERGSITMHTRQVGTLQWAQARVSVNSTTRLTHATVGLNWTTGALQEVSERSACGSMLTLPAVTTGVPFYNGTNRSPLTLEVQWIDQSNASTTRLFAAFSAWKPSQTSIDLWINSVDFPLLVSLTNSSSSCPLASHKWNYIALSLSSFVPHHTDANRFVGASLQVLVKTGAADVCTWNQTLVWNTSTVTFSSGQNTSFALGAIGSVARISNVVKSLGASALDTVYRHLPFSDLPDSSSAECKRGDRNAVRAIDLTNNEKCTCARASGTNVLRFGASIVGPDAEFTAQPLYQVLQQCSDMATSLSHVHPQRSIFAWIADQAADGSCKHECLANPECAAYTYTDGGTTFPPLCTHFSSGVPKNAWQVVHGWRITVFGADSQISSSTVHSADIPSSVIAGGFTTVVEGFWLASATGNITMRWLCTGCVANISVSGVASPNHKYLEQFSDEATRRATDPSMLAAVSPAACTNKANCTFPAQKGLYYFIRTTVNFTGHTQSQAPAVLVVDVDNGVSWHAVSTTEIRPPERTMVSWGCFSPHQKEYPAISRFSETVQSQILQENRDKTTYNVKVAGHFTAKNLTVWLHGVLTSSSFTVRVNTTGGTARVEKQSLGVLTSLELVAVGTFNVSSVVVESSHDNRVLNTSSRANSYNFAASSSCATEQLCNYTNVAMASLLTASDAPCAATKSLSRCILYPDLYKKRTSQASAVCNHTKLRRSTEGLQVGHTVTGMTAISVPGSVSGVDNVNSIDLGSQVSNLALFRPVQLHLPNPTPAPTPAPQTPTSAPTGPAPAPAPGPAPGAELVVVDSLLNVNECYTFNQTSNLTVTLSESSVVYSVTIILPKTVVSGDTISDMLPVTVTVLSSTQRVLRRSSPDDFLCHFDNASTGVNLPVCTWASVSVASVGAVTVSGAAGVEICRVIVNGVASSQGGCFPLLQFDVSDIYDASQITGNTVRVRTASLKTTVNFVKADVKASKVSPSQLSVSPILSPWSPFQDNIPITNWSVSSPLVARQEPSASYLEVEYSTREIVSANLNGTLVSLLQGWIDTGSAYGVAIASPKLWRAFGTIQNDTQKLPNVTLEMGLSMYRWETGLWGACNVTCEEGFLHRDVWCHDLMRGVVVPETNSINGTTCDPATRPAALHPCDAGLSGCEFERKQTCRACNCSSDMCTELNRTATEDCFYKTQRVSPDYCLGKDPPAHNLTCSYCRCFDACKRVWVSQWGDCAKDDNTGRLVRHANIQCTVQTKLGVQLAVVVPEECPKLPVDTPMVEACKENNTASVWEELQQLRLKQMTAQTIQSEQELRMLVPETQAATARTRAAAEKAAAVMELQANALRHNSTLVPSQVEAETTKAKLDAQLADYRVKLNASGLLAEAEVAEAQARAAQAKLLPSAKASYGNINYVGAGYDSFFGNPFPTTGTIDPGFRLPVLDLGCDVLVNSDDLMFSRCSNVHVLRAAANSFSSSVKVVSSQSDYSSMLATDVSVSGSGSGYGASASFSASVSARQSHSSMRSSESVSVYVIGHSTAHIGRVLRTRLSKNLLQYIADLPPARCCQMGSSPVSSGCPPTSECDMYSNFPTTYGTHVATEVTFGGKAVQRSTMNRSSLEEKSAWSTTVKASATASYSGVGVSGSVSTSMSHTSAGAARQAASSSDTESFEFFLGGSAGLGSFEEGNTESLKQWSITVPNNPVPIKYKLLSVQDVLASTYVPNWRGDQMDLEERLGLLRDNVEQYCDSVVPKLQCAPPRPHALSVNFGDYVRVHTTVDDTEFVWVGTPTQGKVKGAVNVEPILGKKDPTFALVDLPEQILAPQLVQPKVRVRRSWWRHRTINYGWGSDASGNNFAKWLDKLDSLKTYVKSFHVNSVAECKDLCKTMCVGGTFVSKVTKSNAPRCYLFYKTYLQSRWCPFRVCSFSLGSDSYLYAKKTMESPPDHWYKLYDVTAVPKQWRTLGLQSFWAETISENDFRWRLVSSLPYSLPRAVTYGEPLYILGYQGSLGWDDQLKATMVDFVYSEAPLKWAFVSRVKAVGEAVLYGDKLSIQPISNPSNIAYNITKFWRFGEQATFLASVDISDIQPEITNGVLRLYEPGDRKAAQGGQEWVLEHESSPFRNTPSGSDAVVQFSFSYVTVSKSTLDIEVIFDIDVRRRQSVGNRPTQLTTTGEVEAEQADERELLSSDFQLNAIPPVNSSTNTGSNGAMASLRFRPGGRGATKYLLRARFGVELQPGSLLSLKVLPGVATTVDGNNNVTEDAVQWEYFRPLYFNVTSVEVIQRGGQEAAGVAVASTLPGAPRIHTLVSSKNTRDAQRDVEYRVDVQFSEHVVTAEREPLEGEDFIVTGESSSAFIPVDVMEIVATACKQPRNSNGDYNTACLLPQTYRLSFSTKGTERLQLTLISSRVRSMSRYAFFPPIKPVPLDATTTL